MFVNKDELRRLANKKASRPIMGEGIPAPNEGVDGDFRLNNSPSGVKLYAKFAGQWFRFSPDSTDVGNKGNKKLHFLSGGHTASSSYEKYWELTFDGGRDSTLAASGGDADELCWVAPFSGIVKSVSVRGAAAVSNTTIRVYKASDGTINPTTQIASETFDWSTAFITYNIPFSSASFASGDMLAISSQHGATSTSVTWTVLIQED